MRCGWRCRKDTNTKVKRLASTCVLSPQTRSDSGRNPKGSERIFAANCLEYMEENCFLSAHVENSPWDWLKPFWCKAVPTPHILTPFRYKYDIIPLPRSTPQSSLLPLLSSTLFMPLPIPWAFPTSKPKSSSSSSWERTMLVGLYETLSVLFHSFLELHLLRGDGWGWPTDPSPLLSAVQ